MEDRYFVVSRNDYIIKGTSTKGYKTRRGAVKARQRIDENDNRSGNVFVPMLVILGEAV